MKELALIHGDDGLLVYVLFLVKSLQFHSRPPPLAHGCEGGVYSFSGGYFRNSNDRVNESHCKRAGEPGI